MKRSPWVSVTMMSIGGLMGGLAAAGGPTRIFGQVQVAVVPASEGTPKVLPRPDFQFKGKIGKTYKDSDPPQFPQPVQAPKGRAEHRVDSARRHGFRAVFHVRGRHPVADPGPVGGGRAAVQPFPHDGPLQPDTGRADHGPQPSLRRDRSHHRGGHGLRWLHLCLAEKLRHDRRGSPPEWICDRLDRQEPQYARVGDECRRAVRPLGQRPRV